VEQLEVPTPWWDAEADKSLLIGVFKHGRAPAGVASSRFGVKPAGIGEVLTGFEFLGGHQGYEKYNTMRADPALCFLEKAGRPDEKAIAAEQRLDVGEG